MKTQYIDQTIARQIWQVSCDEQANVERSQWLTRICVGLCLIATVFFAVLMDPQFAFATSIAFSVLILCVIAVGHWINFVSNAIRQTIPTNLQLVPGFKHQIGRVVGFWWLIVSLAVAVVPQLLVLVFSIFETKGISPSLFGYLATWIAVGLFMTVAPWVVAMTTPALLIAGAGYLTLNRMPAIWKMPSENVEVILLLAALNIALATFTFMWLFRRRSDAGFTMHQNMRLNSQVFNGQAIANQTHGRVGKYFNSQWLFDREFQLRLLQPFDARRLIQFVFPHQAHWSVQVWSLFVVIPSALFGYAAVTGGTIESGRVLIAHAWTSIAIFACAWQLASVNNSDWHLSTREQGLLSLSAKAPQGEVVRELFRSLLIKHWTITSSFVIATLWIGWMVGVEDARLLLWLPTIATSAITGFGLQLADYATQAFDPASRTRRSLAVLFIAALIFGPTMWANSTQANTSFVLLQVSYLVAAIAFAAWRWQRFKTYPVPLPIGRLSISKRS